MPAVPRYERQVAPGALPTVQVARDIQTGDPTAVARASAQVADQTAKMAMQEKGKADDAWGKQAYAEMVSRKNDLLHGQNGALRKQGRDALAILPEAEAEFEKYAEELGAKASNETQRSMLHQFRQREAGELRTTLQRHAAQETERIQDDAFKTLTESLSDDSINNPAKAAENLAMLRAAANDYADRKGWDGADDETRALRKGLLEGLDSRVHGGIVLRMLQQENDRGAKTYFDANKDAITDARMRGQVENALKTGTRLGTAMRLADGLAGKYTDESLAMKDIQAEFEAGRIDAETRQAAELRVSKAFNDRARFNAQAYADNLNQAYLQIEQNKALPNGPVWANVGGKDRKVLTDYLEAVTTGKPIKTKWPAYYDLKRMAADPDKRDQFMGTNLLQYRNRLGDAEFKELTSLQVGLSRKDSKAEKELDDYRTEKQVIDEALSAAKLDPTPKDGTDESVKVANLRRRVAEEVRRLQGQTGKKANNEDIQKIVDGMMMKLYVRETGWDDEYAVGTMTDEQRAKAYVPFDNIPEARVKEAKNLATRPLTNDEVEDAYAALLAGDRERLARILGIDPSTLSR